MLAVLLIKRHWHETYMREMECVGAMCRCVPALSLCAYVDCTFPLVMQLVEKFSTQQVLKVFNNSLSRTGEGRIFCRENFSSCQSAIKSCSQTHTRSSSGSKCCVTLLLTWHNLFYKKKKKRRNRKAGRRRSRLRSNDSRSSSSKRSKGLEAGSRKERK